MTEEYTVDDQAIRPPAWAADRVAFSTLGMPGQPIDAVVAVAERFACPAVELRCAAGEPVTPDSTAAEAGAVADQLADSGVTVSCLATYIRVASQDTDPVADAVRHVKLAAALRAPYIRVFGGQPGQPDATAAGAARLAAIGPVAADTGVTVLLETHDAFVTGAAVAEVLAAADAPGVGAMWDFAHPWRTGEEPAETAAALAPWLRYAQIKDIAGRGDNKPVQIGAGTLPIHDMLAELDGLDYDGYVSLEWERQWHPHLAPLPEALAAYYDVLATYRP